MFVQGLYAVEKFEQAFFICILCNVSQAIFLHPSTLSTASVKKKRRGGGKGGENHPQTNKHKINQKNPTQNPTHKNKNKRKQKTQTKTLLQKNSRTPEKSGLLNDVGAVGLSATSPTGRELLLI